MRFESARHGRSASADSLSRQGIDAQIAQAESVLICDIGDPDGAGDG
jgi:hypothetical protein